MIEKNFMAFDIETCAVDWDTLSESQQEYIVRYAKDDDDLVKKKNEMALSPLTSKCITIGMQLMEFTGNNQFELKKRAAYALDETLDDKDHITLELSSGDFCYLYNERTLLDIFWKSLDKYSPVQLVSFNGRNFDAPFLMLRSALLGIRPSRNLMQGTKFNYQLHTDLIDELTFYNGTGYGATKRYNFDFYTRAFGITSPKSEGIDGSKVADYFAQGRIAEIAEYCLRDVVATWQLYEVWRKFLMFPPPFAS